MTAKRVFLLTSGEYSDYSVLATYSTKKAAKTAQKAYSVSCGVRGIDALSIEEVPLDVPIMRLYRSECFLYSSGKIVFDLVSSIGSDGTARTPMFHRGQFGSYGEWCITGYGKSKEHARRSADQLRREKKAIGEIK